MRALVLGGVLHKGPSSAEAQGRGEPGEPKGCPAPVWARPSPPPGTRQGWGRPSVGEFYLP